MAQPNLSLASMISPNLTIALIFLGAAGIHSSFAGPTTATTPSAAAERGTGKLAEPSAFDRFGSIPVLYHNAQNPLLEELAIQGQLQVQYASGSSGDTDYGSCNLPESCRWGDTEVRRFRLGLRARMLKTLKFHLLIDIDPDFSPRIYQRTPEAYFTYAPCDAFNLAVGKTELKFTREQEVSSRELLPFERSQLVNMLYGGELTGAWLAGKNIAGGWLYELGAYNNERVDEFTHFHGGTMVLAKIGYNYTQASGCDHAQVQLHYLHNTRPGYATDKTTAASPLFSDCLALSNDLTIGRFSLATECFWADGHGCPNVGGVTAMPTYHLTDKLQLITTFQLAASNGDSGICLPTRYEQMPGGNVINGDSYFAGYAGLNYYFHGHKLKAMTGAKYSCMSGGTEDFSGWTWLVGCRTAF